MLKETETEDAIVCNIFIIGSLSIGGGGGGGGYGLPPMATPNTAEQQILMRRKKKMLCLFLKENATLFHSIFDFILYLP